MNQLTKFLVDGILNEGEQRVIAAYGGGFKPPTSGHFEVVKQALKNHPEIDEFIIYVGSGTRDGITQAESVLIWEIYQTYLPMKVKIEPSKAPIGDILRLGKNNPQDKVYFVLGAREENEGDFEDIKNRTRAIGGKHPNVEVKVITTVDKGMSGTNARKAAKVSFEDFAKFLPTELSDDEKEIVYNIVKPVVKESLNKSFYLDIPKFNQPKTIQQYLIENIKEISLSKENAVDINGDLTGGTFTVGDITYEYSIKNIPNPYKDLGLFYNIQFTPKGEVISIPKGGEENYIKILSTMYKIIVDFIEKEQPEYVGISSLDNSGGKNYHTVYNRLTTNTLNLIPGYFRKDSNLIFDSPQGKGRFIVLKRKESLNENASYSQDIDIKQRIMQLTQHMLDKGMNIEPLPNVEFVDGDNVNAREFLGKTAYYDPNSATIVLYTEGRHPKDIVRSFSHEMIHHIQNLEGRLDNITTTNTQEDDTLNDIETEANLKGTMTFRNWTDSLNESKQVGVIYHYTTFENGLKILQSNQLKADHAADSTNAKPVYSISFTRDKRFHDNHRIGFTDSSFGQTPQVRFTVDGNKLSNKYKVQPYSQGGVFSKGRKGFEAEERVISDKPFTIPLSNYLLSVDILLEYKKPSNKYDLLGIVDYELYAPLSAELVKFTQDKNLPVNLIVNKNGDPWPDKAKKTILQKILNWFSINEANLKGTMTFRNWTDSLNEVKKEVDNSMVAVSSGDGHQISLYDFKNKEPLGLINTYENAVTGVVAKKGYGPLMYELGMANVYPNSLQSDRNGNTEPEAQAVWDKFIQGASPNIKVEKLTPKDKEYRTEYPNGNEIWDVDGFYNYKFYNPDTSTLKNLLKKGNELYPDEQKQIILSTKEMYDNTVNEAIVGEKIEQEANLRGTMTFRNWTDSLNEGLGDVSLDYIKTKLPKLDSYPKSDIILSKGDFTYINIPQDKDFGMTAEIKAFDQKDGTLVAQSSFDYDKNGKLKGTLDVRPDKRRLGIATEIYKLAEKIIGDTIFPEEKHTEDAEKFWQQKNRSFGPKTDDTLNEKNKPYKHKPITKEILFEEEDKLMVEVVNPDGERFEYEESNIKGLYTYKDSLDNLYFARITYSPSSPPRFEFKVGWFEDNDISKPKYDPQLPPNTTSMDDLKRRNTVAKIYRDEILPYLKDNQKLAKQLDINPISQSRYIFSQRLIQHHTPSEYNIDLKDRKIVISLPKIEEKKNKDPFGLNAYALELAKGLEEDLDTKARLKRGLDYITKRKEASKKKTQRLKKQKTNENLNGETTPKMSFEERLAYYKDYYINVSPSTFDIMTEDGTIVIGGLDKPYSPNFDEKKDVRQVPVNENVPDAEDDGKAAPYGSGYKKINEGRYDTLANQLSKIAFQEFKDIHDRGDEEGTFKFRVDHPDEEHDIPAEEFYFDFEGIVKITDDEYNVDGGANVGFDDKGDEITPILSVKFKIPKNPDWQKVSFDIKDVVRHELEHLTQDGDNEKGGAWHEDPRLRRPSKYIQDDQFLRDMIDANLLPKSDYFKLEKEVDAMLQGMYFKAKKSKTPFKKVLNDYLDIFVDQGSISKEEKENILNVWRSRRKALSLPSF
jgi:hypothetical protein